MTLTNKTWLKSEVLRLFLSGESQENIAIQLNISVGTVNNLVSDIIKSDDTIELQRQIAIISKKNGVSIPQIAVNMRWKNQIKQSALDDKKTEKFLDAIDIWCNKYSIPPTTLADHLLSIIEITLREHVEPDKLEEVIKSKISELREIDDQMETSKKLLEESKTKQEEEQMHLKINQKDLEQFHSFSELLDLYNLPEISTEYGDVVHALIDIKNMGYDPKVIVSQYEKFESLTKANEKLKVKQQEMEELLRDYKRKLDEQESKWKEQGYSLEVITRLVRDGLRVEDIFVAVNILENDFSPDQIKQLIEDIKTYGSVSAAMRKLKSEYREDKSLF